MIRPIRNNSTTTTHHS